MSTANLQAAESTANSYVVAEEVARESATQQEIVFSLFPGTWCTSYVEQDSVPHWSAAVPWVVAAFCGLLLLLPWW